MTERGKSRGPCALHAHLPSPQSSYAQSLLALSSQAPSSQAPSLRVPSARVSSPHVPLPCCPIFERCAGAHATAGSDSAHAHQAGRSRAVDLKSAYAGL